MVRPVTLRIAVPVLVLAAISLAGCGGANLNPFKKEEQLLPGDRISVALGQEEIKVDPVAAKSPVSLPAPKRNEEWSQPGGSPDNALGHLELGGGLATVWSADVGTGSSDSGRLTASPIVYQGKVFAMDVEGQLAAFSTSGARVWRISLVPENERGRAGFGGGLAADGGRLYVTTGFGTVVAVNPASGEIFWTRKIGTPIRTAPTAVGGDVYFVTSESTMYCLSGNDGNERWSHRGIPETATLLSNVSPAVGGNRVIAPFPSGDVVGYDRQSGKPAWAESLAMKKTGSSLTALSDPARPVLDGGVLFAVSHAGRMVATSADNGARVWTKSIRSTQMPWVAGDNVFVVDVSGKLIALTRRDGKVRWTLDLPQQTKWNGPVLASGKLWLVSSSGLVVGVDAKAGTIATQRNIGEAVYIAPIVAAGRMYILTDEAKLFAMN